MLRTMLVRWQTSALANRATDRHGPFAPDRKDSAPVAVGCPRMQAGWWARSASHACSKRFLGALRVQVTTCCVNGGKFGAVTLRG